VPALVERVTRLTERERLFTLSPEGAVSAHTPGQFFMAGLPGHGEAPFSITSPPGAPLELCIRAVGNLTNALHRLGKGDRLWVRGPFGRGFSVDAMRGKDVLFIAGGIGIAPMRSLIRAVLGMGSGGRFTLIYGAKTPDEMLFGGEMDDWAARGMDVRLTVDAAGPGWKGHRGVVTALIPGLELDWGRTLAVVIGPPVMYRFVVFGLRQKSVAPGNILLSLERRMKCGLGKCGHCQINSIYVCQEGPVFRLDELEGLPEAF
jgi:NAD(P)H-flavin reductase